VRFLWPKTGEYLLRIYSASDVFVFPSRTDTFGLVMLEALACGLPVAAYPVPGPRDVVGDAPVAMLDDDLRAACMRALALANENADGRSNLSARGFALEHSWRTCTQQFLSNLALEPPED